MADDVLDLLLKTAPAKLPEKNVKMLRLSAEAGADVIFSIRAISYNRIAEIQDSKDLPLQLLLEGIVKPDLKNDRLLAKYNTATPMELLRDGRFLLPGEVADLARQIEMLSGYRKTIFKEIEKN